MISNKQEFIVFYSKILKQIKICFENFQTPLVTGIYGSGHGIFVETAKEFFRTQFENILEFDFSDLPSLEKRNVYRVFQDLNCKTKISNDFELHYCLKGKINDKNSTLLIISGAEKLLNMPDSFFDNFGALKNYAKNRLSIIFIARSQVLYSQSKGFKRSFDKIYFLPFFDRKTTLFDIKKQGINADKFLHEKIFKISKGHHGLIKFLCFMIKKFGINFLENKKRFIKIISNDNKFQYFFSMFIKSFSNEQLSLIIKYLNKKSLNPIEQNSIAFEQLKLLGIFFKKNDKIKLNFEIFFPLITKFILKKFDDSNRNLKIENGQIIFDQINLSAFLTRSENLILSTLITKKPQIVSNDEISNLIWNKKDEKFSLWAISKHISRLMKKLKMYTGNNVKIKTTRNKGYCIW